MIRRALVFFCGLAALWMTVGCATPDEAANRSERPWNSPESWEHGIPASMMEGR